MYIEHADTRFFLFLLLFWAVGSNNNGGKEKIMNGAQNVKARRAGQDGRNSASKQDRTGQDRPGQGIYLKATRDDDLYGLHGV